MPVQMFQLPKIDTSAITQGNEAGVKQANEQPDQFMNMATKAQALKSNEVQNYIQMADLGMRYAKDQYALQESMNTADLAMQTMKDRADTNAGYNFAAQTHRQMGNVQDLIEADPSQYFSNPSPGQIAGWNKYVGEVKQTQDAQQFIANQTNIQQKQLALQQAKAQMDIDADIALAAKGITNPTPQQHNNQVVENSQRAADALKNDRAKYDLNPNTGAVKSLTVEPAKPDSDAFVKAMLANSKSNTSIKDQEKNKAEIDKAKLDYVQAKASFDNINSSFDPKYSQAVKLRDPNYGKSQDTYVKAKAKLEELTKTPIQEQSKVNPPIQSGANPNDEYGYWTADGVAYKYKKTDLSKVPQGDAEVPYNAPDTTAASSSQSDNLNPRDFLKTFLETREEKKDQEDKIYQAQLKTQKEAKNTQMEQQERERQQGNREQWDANVFSALTRLENPERYQHGEGISSDPGKSRDIDIQTMRDYIKYQPTDPLKLTPRIKSLMGKK